MKCNEVLRLLKENGWTVIGQRGSHMKMINEQNPENGNHHFSQSWECRVRKGIGEEIIETSRNQAIGDEIKITQGVCLDHITHQYGIFSF